MKISKSIENENRLLIEIREERKVDKVGSKPSLKLYFKAGNEDRLFPLETVFRKKEDGFISFTAKAAIYLPSVFLDKVEGEVCVRTELFYGTKRERIGEAFYLEARFFNEKRGVEKKKSSLLQFVFAFFLIPAAILSSFKAKKRGRALVGAANRLIKEWTGISFSVREFKTDYFRKQYERFASLPIEPFQILFLSERRVEEGGNLFLILKVLQKEKNFNILTFLEERTVDKLSLKELKNAAYLIATSKLIILEDFYPQLHALDLREETKVLQLWHACGAFKTFGFSRLFKPGGPEEGSKNHRNYDRAFVSSEAIIPLYSEAFAISENKVLSLGTPRTDIFFDENYKEEVRKKLFKEFPAFLGKRIILFAPTFRGLGNKDAFYPEKAFSVKDFMKGLSADVILMIKQHPFVKTSLSVPDEYKERVFDLSKGFPINDLLFITDLLITDYSSSVFEAALLDIPMLFYVFDEETYLRERDIYGDFDSFIPGKKTRSMTELIEKTGCILSGVQSQSYDLKAFKERYLSALDGKSTERIRNYILSLVVEEEK